MTSPSRQELSLEPGGLRISSAPYRHGMPGINMVTLTFLLATAPVLAAGVVLFGWNTLRILAICGATALLTESAMKVLSRHSRIWSEGHALLIGLLFACTLPPTVSWLIPASGTVLAVILGQLLSGGVGNSFWHPVAMARVFMQLFFAQHISPEKWPVLAAGRLVWGNLSHGQPLPPLQSWFTATPPEGVQAWLMHRPVDFLRGLLPVPAETSPAEALAQWIGHILPSWPEALLGLSAGAVGQACVAAVVIGGFILLWRGFLRWPMVLSAMGAAALAAIVLPMTLHLENGDIAQYWLPGLAFHEQMPVGFIYVIYQLTAADFIFVVCLLASDPSSSPLTSRGHAVFGLILGTATIALRVLIGLPAAPFWALLLANTLVPTIDNQTRRRVLGT
jgi:electron transport complex protein RnfD